MTFLTLHFKPVNSGTASAFKSVSISAHTSKSRVEEREPDMSLTDHSITIMGFSPFLFYSYPGSAYQHVADMYVRMYDLPTSNILPCAN